jgi:adenosine deaminase
LTSRENECIHNPRKLIGSYYSFFPLFSSYIYSLCDSFASITYSTKSVLESFEADGVIYLELRTTPRNIPTAEITKDLYVQTVLGCINEHNTRPEAQMVTKLILSIDRRMTANEADEIVDLAIRNMDSGVVGLDLCGDPSKGDVSMFTAAFAKARSAGLRLTVHFAEAISSSTEKELQTILSWNPHRLGHVIHVNDNIKQQIVQRHIGVELCLSCNVHAKMITGSYSDHHFGWWHTSGVGVAISVSTYAWIRMDSAN